MDNFRQFQSKKEDSHGDKDQNCHICALECDNKPKLPRILLVWNSVQNSSTLKVQSIQIVFDCLCHFLGFLGVSDGKESACNVGDPRLIPGLGRSSVEGNANPLQHSCLENPMDRGAWWATVYIITKSQT